MLARRAVLAWTRAAASRRPWLGHSHGHGHGHGHGHEWLHRETRRSFGSTRRLRNEATGQEGSARTSDVALASASDAGLDVASMSPRIDHIGALQELGLSSNWTPVGWIQQALEMVHVTTGSPWWLTIIATTVVIRTALFPLLVRVQANTARLSAVQPIVNAKMTQLREAQRRKERQEAALLVTEIQGIYKEANASPLKSLILPVVQAPIFISFFLALRAISDLDIPDLRNGGLAWFTDLTVADPIYLLPVLSAGMTWAVIELGMEAGPSATANASNVKIFARVLTLVSVPFIASFPTSVLVYWTTSNSFSLFQTLFLRIPAVKSYFKIPNTLPPPPPAIDPKTGEPAKAMGFLESFKSSYRAAVEKDRENRAEAERKRVSSLRPERRRRKR